MKRGWLGAGALVVGIASLLGVLAYVLDHARATVRVVRGLGEAAEPAREEALAVPEEPGDELEPARVTSTGLAPRPAGLEVFVASADGKRIPFVDVLAYREGRLLRAMETSTVTGSMIPFDGPATLRAEWNTYELARLEVPDGHGCYELVVTSTAGVSGSVRVDGEPREGLQLELFSGSDDGLAGWLGNRMESAGLRRRRSLWMAQTEAGGAFEFRLLPPQWSGALRVGDRHHYRFADGSRQLALAGPQVDLLVELASVQQEVRLHGRVVLDGRPVPGAAWEAGRVGRGACDALGRFSIPALAEELGGECLVFSAAGVGERTLEPDERGTATDLGDVELLRTREVSVVVRASTGAPIEGAWAVPRSQTELGGRCSHGFRLLCQATDGAGRTVLLHLQPGETAIRVAARGYAQADVTVPEPAVEPFEIVLQREAAVRVFLRDPSGRVPPGLRVRLESRVPPLAYEDGLAPPESGLFVFMTGGSASPAGDGFQGDFVPDERGRAWVDPLRAGTPVDLVAVDGLGHELASARGLVLDPGEWRRVDLRVDARPRSVIVSVRDSFGVPLEGAKVRLARERAPGGVAMELTTDRAGMARTEPFYAAALSLSVEGRGFESRRLEHLRVPTEGATLEIRLAHEWFAW